MSSPGADFLRGWFRCTRRFIRGYCLGLAAVALLLIVADLLYPEARLFCLLRDRLFVPFPSSPP
ncbi:MAG: hypothetical protein ACHQX0_07465 [Desulfobaccales bacterium]